MLELAPAPLAAVVLGGALCLAVIAQEPETEPPPKTSQPGAHGGHQGHHGDHHGSDHHGSDHHRHGPEGVHHDFADAQRWFRIFEGEERDRFQKPAEVVKLMELRPGMTVADLGAGTGYFLPYLTEAVGGDGRVLALDPEVNLVDFMAERIQREGWANAEARQIPYDSPALEGASVDRILIVNTWHHISDRRPYSALLRDALKPGGRVMVVDYTKESPRGPSVEHRLPPETVIEELEAGGLEARVLEEELPWQYVVVGVRPAG